MYKFNFCNHNLENWIEKNNVSKTQIIETIKKNQCETFDIELAYKLSKNSVKLFEVENNKVIYKNENLDGALSYLLKSKFFNRYLQKEEK